MATRPPGSWNNADIWMSVWMPDGGWGEPINLGYPAKCETGDRNPSLSFDGKLLYFNSYRPGGCHYTPKAISFRLLADLSKDIVSLDITSISVFS
jgi:hypothetical protein